MLDQTAAALAAFVQSPMAQRASVHAAWVCQAVSLAVAIAIPLCVLASWSGRLARGARWACEIVSWVPALAWLALCAALLHRESSTLWFLVVCTLPPLIRGFLAGVRAIDRSLAELAVALGLPWATRMRLVGGPMALPSVVSGLADALVAGSAATTLAAIGGAGGFGELIVEGLAAGDTRQMVAGAALATVFTLVCRIGALGIPWLLAPLWGVGELYEGRHTSPVRRDSR